MLRLFTALTPSSSVAHELQNLKTDIEGVRWLNPQTYHCTLVYFGDVNVYLYRQIKQQLKYITFNPFTVKISHFELFKNSENETYSLVAIIETEQRLVELQYEMNSIISMFHPNLEMKNRFRPHISIARLNSCDRDRIENWKTENNSIINDSFEVNQFALFSSRPTSSGSVYTKMENYDMELIAK
jgi:RNA 2',3'-cyclic 3'-phosphodiesterase